MNKIVKSLRLFKYQTLVLVMMSWPKIEKVILKNWKSIKEIVPANVV